jgi:hypothetical protein
LDVNERTASDIDIVVTLNADDKKRVGEREEYVEYYRSLNITNLRFGGYDQPNVSGRRFQKKKKEFSRIWLEMCSRIESVSLQKYPVTDAE